MKLNIFKVIMISIIAFMMAISCTKEDTSVETPQDDYGHIQFKLYKEASYEPSARASRTDESNVVDELEFLNDAKRIQLTMLFNNTTISQSVDLSAYDANNAEWGLRSEKLQLLSGDYQITSFDLFDIRDNIIYNSTSAPMEITVPKGGLEIFDLTVKTKERGRVRFTFEKYFPSAATRGAVSDIPRFLSTKYARIQLVETSLSEQVYFDSIPVSVNASFDVNDMQSVTLESDSMFVIKAGTWRVNEFSFYDISRQQLYVAKPTPATETIFEVSDNVVAEPRVLVEVNEDSEQIKDYKALYAIWKALGGEPDANGKGGWNYQGQLYPKGANWDFNKEIDLWGYQPGVLLHPNGRVASLNISEFGFKGDMPAEIGQLTELLELFLGTHNDVNGYIHGHELQGMAINGDISENRWTLGKNYLESHAGNSFANGLSPLLRKAYVDRNVSIPGGITVTQEQIESQIRGEYNPQSDAPMARADVSFNTYCNGLTSLPEEIGNLKSLQTLFIANGKLKTLPESLKNLTNLTDMELYNCPDMEEFPTVLAKMPNLVALNIAQNAQWSAKTIYEGLNAILESETIQKSLQLLYCNGNKLEVLPQSLDKISNLGLLDMASNNISTVYSMPNFRPVQLMLDNNNITELPKDFCNTEDVESISFNNNKLTKFPNIFSKDDISIESISFAYNLIDSVEDAGENGEVGGFNGISVKMLNLSGNKFTTYPAVFAASSSAIAQMNISNNLISSFEENAFVGENVWALESLDVSRNMITSIPGEINGKNTPYLFGLDLSYNRLSSVPFSPLNCSSLTIYIVRGQRDESGNRTLKSWPDKIGTHTGLRGLFLGSNDIREVRDDISFLIFNMDIADNPNIIFDASDICYYIQMGMYNLYYDKSQDIRNCSILGTN